MSTFLTQNTEVYQAIEPATTNERYVVLFMPPNIYNCTILPLAFFARQQLTWLMYCVFLLMTRSSTLLQLGVCFVLTACSVQYDSQYGLRLNPFERTIVAHDRNEREVNATEHETTVVPTLEPQGFANSPMDYSIQGSIELHFSNQAFNTESTVGQTFATEAMDAARVQIVTHDLNESADHEKFIQPERSMLMAWFMWGVPVLLMLTGAGFLLNFGLHWYYLGKNRHANTATFIWALTVATSVIVWFLNSLHLGILAFLVGLVVLLPLLVIQLIRVVKDAILLNKIATKKTRREARRQDPKA